MIFLKFRYALDEYSGARRTAVVNSFISALTVGDLHLNFSFDQHRNISHTRPIEMHSHDPLRFASDILAWIHQLAASEKEHLNSLCRSCKDKCKLFCLYYYYY